LAVGERAGDPRHQPHRPQIDVLIELAPPSHQRAPEGEVVWDLGGPADGAEEDRVMAADLLLPILRHHAAILFEIFDTGEVEPIELEGKAVFLGGLLKGAHALGRHFLADAIPRYDGDAIGFLHDRAPRPNGPDIRRSRRAKWLVR